MNHIHAPLERAAVLQQLQFALARITARVPSSLVLLESSRLREDLGLDSFAAVELVFEVEDLFEVRIPQGTAISFQTVGDVISYLSTELASPRASVALPDKAGAC